MKNRIALFNVLSGLFLQICVVISGFIVPRIILKNFGSEVNGLVSSINQFLSYISLVEGGITGVVIANLYKPLVDKDNKYISSVLVTAKNFYKNISFIFVAYTLFLGIIYPLITKISFSREYVFTLTIILSLSLYVQYMFSLTLKTLLEADKKSYIVSITQSIIVILNIVLTCITVMFYQSIHVLKLFSGVLFIIQPLVFKKYINKNYCINWNEKRNNDLLKSRWNGFAINVAAFIHNSTDITVLTLLGNLQMVSIYSVYVLVTNGIKQLINSATSSLVHILGQAYTRQDFDDLNFKLDVYEYIICFLVFFAFTMTALLITPFVMIYTKGVTDVSYYQPTFGILISISEALYLLKAPHQGLAYSANRFKDISKPAYIEAAINIIVSIFLVKNFGLVGVAIGTICGMMYRLVFHVKYTKNIIDNRKTFLYFFKLMIFMFGSILGTVIINSFLPIIQYNIINWIEHAVLYGLVLFGVYALISIVFFRKELFFLKKYITR